MKTIAEERSEVAARITLYCQEIETILRREGRNLSLPYIEFYLQELRIGRGENIRLDTFEVREALSELISAGTCQRSCGKGVWLAEAAQC
jgi:hypothetical protein